MPTFDTAALRSATIHVANASDGPVAFAAVELQRYLQRMTGVQVPIACDAMPNTLVLGAAATTTEAARNPQTFVIDPEPSRLILQSGSPRALLSAVYALLERLGCRWSLHGPDEEIVPRLAGTVQLDRFDHTPRFAVRVLSPAGLPRWPAGGGV